MGANAPLLADMADAVRARLTAVLGGDEVTALEAEGRQTPLPRLLDLALDGLDAG
jgi:hypothetical protein